jgi:hypothetical protein
LKIEVIEKSNEPVGFWDRLGVIASALCLLHCLLTPLVLGFLTARGLGFLGEEIFHQVLAIGLVFVAIFAFAPAFRQHRRWGIITAGAVGIFLLLFTGFAPHHLLPEYADVGLTMAGSILLVGAHMQNRRCLTGC